MFGSFSHREPYTSRGWSAAARVSSKAPENVLPGVDCFVSSAACVSDRILVFGDVFESVQEPDSTRGSGARADRDDEGVQGSPSFLE